MGRILQKLHLGVDTLVVVVEDEPAVLAVLLLLTADLFGNNLSCQGNDAAKVVGGIEHLHKWNAGISQVISTMQRHRT